MSRVQLTIRGHGRSPKVKWGHNPFFAKKSRQDGDRDAQMAPNELARPAASEDVHSDLLGPWSDLDLTWPGVKFSNWPLKVKKYMFWAGSTRRTRWCHFHISHIKKVINEKTSPWKTIAVHLMTTGDKIIDLRWNLIEKCYRGMKRTPQCVFRILLSYYSFGGNSDRLQKIAIFSKFDLWWPLVTSILTWKSPP